MDDETAQEQAVERAAQLVDEGLTPFEAAVEVAARSAETVGVDHAVTVAALALVEEERRGEQVRTRHPRVRLTDYRAG